jgi:hypothetical protein
MSDRSLCLSRSLHMDHLGGTAHMGFASGRSTLHRKSAMRGISAGSRHDAIFRLVVEPRPAGRTIGYLDELPISEMVVDRFGRRLTYVGVAPRTLRGTYCVDELRPGEFIVEPGLLYELDGAKLREGRRAPPDLKAASPHKQAWNLAKAMTVALAIWLTGVLATHLLLVAFT